MREGPVVVLGVFVADTAYRAARQPRMGETILGSGFALGPGGKGSNQAVAAAMAGAETHMITRLGRDAFGEMALETWARAGVTPAVERSDTPTGAAYIFVDEATGDNAIIVYPGAAGALSAADVEAQGDLIGRASVVMTQLEQPVEAAAKLMAMGRAAGAVTILNPAPAPAEPLPAAMIADCDWLTPNESEAEAMTGLPVGTVEEAERAAGALREMGAAGVVLTLGERGALLATGKDTTHVPALRAGDVVETTGAGDAFAGAFAAGLARGLEPLGAVRLGCAGAAISVTRPGTAPSMPALSEIEALLGG